MPLLADPWVRGGLAAQSGWKGAVDVAANNNKLLERDEVGFGNGGAREPTQGKCYSWEWSSNSLIRFGVRGSCLT